MDAVILAGGKGTRLATVVNDVPKPLAPVHGRPFLDYVLDFLVAGKAVSRFIFATGHLADKVEQHYGAQYRGIDIVYSRETLPLGTGGAVLQAMRQVAQSGAALSNPFLLLNGDSFVNAALAPMLQLHQQAAAGLTLSLFQVPDAARFGTVTLDGGKVSGFHEKTGVAAPGLINSGIYLLDPQVLLPWSRQTGFLSLETDIMPQLVAAGRVHAIPGGNRFIDIGLPETYQAAPDFFATE